MSVLTRNLGIIGGGMTGTYAAYLASVAKIKTTVFERLSEKGWMSDPLSTRRCGEGIWEKKLNNAGINTSSTNPLEYLNNCTDQLLLGFIGKDKPRLIIGKIDPYYFIDRQKFELSYFRKAREAGSNWEFGRNINDVSQFQKAKEYSLLIGSWGTNPPVENNLLNKSYHQEYVLACQTTVSGLNSKKTNNAKVLILTDDPLVRYYYIFPKGNGSSEEANIGVVFNQISHPRAFEDLNGFIKTDPLAIFKNTKIIDNRSFAKILPCGRPIGKKDILVDKTILIGDAGFSTDAISGGGIGYGLLLAKCAVEACLENKPLDTYYQMAEPLFRDLNRSYEISKKMYPLTSKEKIKANNRYRSAALSLLRQGGFLSLGKIAEEIF